MNYTNKHDLPDWVYAALSNSRYQRGAKPSDISVTRLIDSPMIRSLSESMGDQVEVDAIDQVYSTLGSGVHYWFELAGEVMPHIRTEERLYAERGGKTLSGQYDVYDERGIIWDVKVTSVWTVINGDVKWLKQLNVLKWLAEQNDMSVTGLRILVLMRDWQRSKALRDKSYPQHPLGIVEIPMWDNDRVERYIDGRLKAHFRDPPGCSNEERWLTSTVYAVKKDGRKSALKLCESNEEAAEYIDAHKDAKKLFVEVREGEARRCELYCPVSKWCTVK